MTEDLKKRADARMQKAVDTLKNVLARLRTGRAHVSLLDHIRVAYYGSEVPLNQVANVAASDARTLSITPWEKQMIPVIEKAIMTSDLGLTPATAGNVIRVPMPQLTEERRREIIKLARQEAEGARVAIRNARRDANTELKSALKDRKITEDQERRTQDDIQKLTDRHIAGIDKILAAKETELLEV
ncbi:MAG: ribosome recycling factor [Gammaproteobacteria bacterium]|nr:ribosome recycling factor [Gammaproteobacteria bacterium]MDE1886842.1 ribosome recycling factor [Gammaproteobacteria bacterium]MDE2024460.1 ribosome recycling factor [Gammaproteobacteria bacterium]MDE2273908.1 ribosome recycling factor [Gammaproteobacteria bacterium]